MQSFTDHLRYDAETKHLFVVAAVPPSVEVFKQIDQDHYKPIGEVTTEPKARVGLYVPERRRFYVAGPRSEEKEAHILVYQVDGTTQFKEGRYVQSKQKQIQRAIPFDSDLLDDDETALAADSLFALLDEEENDSASRGGLAVRPGNGGERGVAAKVNKNGRLVAEKVYWGVEVWRVQLSSQETTLLDAFRRLPPDAANELAALAQRLAALSPNTRIDWSDSWSEADLRDLHSLKRFEVEEEQH